MRTSSSQYNNTKTSITRDSNIEILRIVAMLLVLIVHACFLSIGKPTQDEIFMSPIPISLRFLTESLSDICVNIFIFISGWFGIRSKNKRFLELIFQVWFMSIALYVIFWILGREGSWSLQRWINIFIYFNGNWFVLSYIVLYIISPLLNSFAENTPRSRFKDLLIAFFVAQTIFGFIYNTNFFSYGYSPLSFIGLYLLARYIRLYPNRWTVKSKWFDIGMYLCTSFLTMLCAMTYTITTGKTDRLFYAYTSPLIIIGAIYFFLCFSKIKFQSKSVNWVASSAFAVFLLHTDPIFFMPYYLGPIRRWFYGETLAMFIVNTSVRILCVFVIAIFIDKIRIAVWNFICSVGSKIQSGGTIKSQ